MLFTVKRTLFPTLLLGAFVGAASLFLRHLLQIPWDASFRPDVLLLGAGSIAASDGLSHAALWLGRGTRYLQRYQALVTYFAPQGVPEIIAGGVLAAAEELFFRGILLQGALTVLGWSPLPALLASTLAFAALHIIGRRNLAPFALWAFWEGLLLGLVYLLGGSLLVSALVHGLHDSGGFGLFAFQRRSGWLLPAPGESG